MGSKKKKRRPAGATKAESSSGLSEPKNQLPTVAPRLHRGLRVLLTLAATVGPLALFTGFTLTPELPFPTLWRIGICLAGASALLAFATQRAKSGHQRILGLLTLALGCLGLAALQARHPEVHLTPFPERVAHFVGLPSLLPFLGLAAASLILKHDFGSMRGRILLGIATLWGTACLFFPNYILGELHFPVTTAFAWLDLGDSDGLKRLSGVVILTLLLSISASWFFLWRLMCRPDPVAGRHEEESLATFGLPAAGAVVLAVHHLLAPFFLDSADWVTWITALTQAALVVALPLGLTLSTWNNGMGESIVEKQRVWNLVEKVALCSILGMYALLKTHGMGPSNTDENIYFYMAAKLGSGQWPYVDYFFAHPPLHVLIPGTFFAVFGYSFAAAKSISAIAGGISGLLVWAIGKECFGRVAGIVAMVAFLFAGETLKATTNMTGINLTTMWVLMALWHSLEWRCGKAGICFGLAACTGFYSMAGICAVLLLTFFRNRRAALTQLGVFVLVAGSINLIFFALAPVSYIDGVYIYHGLKPLKESGMVPLWGDEMNPLSALLRNISVMVQAKPFTKDVYYHAHLWLAGLVAPALGIAVYFLDQQKARQPWRFFSAFRLWVDGRDGRAGIIWLLAVAFFVQYAMFRELYSFYFVLIYPFLALLLGYVMERVLSLMTEALTTNFGPGASRARVGIAVITLILCSLWVPWSARANLVFGDETKNRGQRTNYVWRDAPVLSSLSGVVQTLFWEDYRLKGELERGYRHYLWNKKRYLESLPSLVTYLREHAQPNATLIGPSGLAPLVALESGLRLAANEADTNSKRFKAARRLPSGSERDTTALVDEKGFWQAVCDDNVQFILSASRSYFTPKKMKQLKTVKRWFARKKMFQDRAIKHSGPYSIALYERVRKGTPCKWE